MRIAVIGVGGVGGYFGARLAAAGHEVVFVARGKMLEALRHGGLKLTSVKGDLHLPKVLTAASPRHAGPCDLALVCVKLWDSAAIVGELAHCLKPEGAAISLQNGVDALDWLKAALPPHQVMGGTCAVSSFIQEPGHIKHVSSFADMTFGELSGEKSARAEVFDLALTKAGIEHKVSPRILVDIWMKFLLLSPMAGACCFFRVAADAICKDPAKFAVLRQLVEEAGAVARASGIPLVPEAEEKTLARHKSMPQGMKPSMLLDLERGNRLELEWLTGAVARRGERLHVPTPQSRKVFEALLPVSQGVR